MKQILLIVASLLAITSICGAMRSRPTITAKDPHGGAIEIDVRNVSSTESRQDYDSEFTVYGQFPTPCHRVQITKIQIEGEVQEIKVYWQVIPPLPGTMCSMVIANQLKGRLILKNAPAYKIVYESLDPVRSGPYTGVQSGSMEM